MENIEKKTPLNDLMDTTMDKIRDCLLYTSDAADEL